MLHKRILLVLPEGIRQHFSPLIDAWSGRSIGSEVWEYSERKIPGREELSQLAEGFQAMLIIGDWRFSPAKVLDAPFLLVKDKRIPVSWLPVRNLASLKKFIATATIVQQRKKREIALGILSQQMPRYLLVAGKMVSELQQESGNIRTFSWSSGRVFPEDMLTGLNTGLGAAIYLGHGRPNGWAGYFGIRMSHLISFANKPLGTVMSLCCHTANRKNVGISFSENLVLEGISASSFGATKATLYTDNMRWAVNICQSLARGIDNIGELIVDALPHNAQNIHSYRLMGDPLAPLFAETDAIRLARKIKIYQ